MQEGLNRKPNFKELLTSIREGALVSTANLNDPGIPLEERNALSFELATRLEKELETLKVADQKNKEEISHLREVVGRDPLLDDLLNREYLIDILESLIRQLNQKDERRDSPQLQSVVVVNLDINKFKTLNDKYGHQVGDEALKNLSKRLMEATRARDHIFRVGGDEFLITMPIYETSSSAKDALPDVEINSLLERLKKINNSLYVDLEGKDGKIQKRIPFSISMGFEILKRGTTETAEDILHSADQKMYREKAVPNS